jgi:hypothetical protein
LDDYVTANLLADPAQNLAAGYRLNAATRFVTGQDEYSCPGTWCRLEQLDYEGVVILLRQDLMQPIVPPDVIRKDDHV